MKTARRKRTKSSRRSRLGLGLAALGFLVVIILIGKFIQLVVSLNSPMSPGSRTEEKISLWNGKTQINLVISASQTYLLSFDPEGKSAEVLQIPDNTYLDLPFQLGSWPISSFYQLGQAEKPPVGGVLLKNSLSIALGIPIDGYLVFEDPQSDAQLLVDNLKQGVLSGLLPFKGNSTDLSRVEYWRFMRGFKGVRSDRLNIYDLDERNMTQGTTLPDGTPVQSFDAIKLDSFLQKNIPDGNLKAEEMTIGIYNATDHPGLAEKASRMVNNMGGRVIITASIPVKLGNSMVVGKQSYTRERLANIFAPVCNQKPSPVFGFLQSQKPCQVTDPNLNQSRSDINIILGEDYYLRYNSPK